VHESVSLFKGRTLHCETRAGRLGSVVDAELQQLLRWHSLFESSEKVHGEEGLLHYIGQV
jgi:hypothetical protein